VITLLGPRDIGRAAALYRGMIDFLSRKRDAAGRALDPGL
jgi:hypothetical protein